MCQSQAQGGQRCHSHAAAALTAAESRYRKLRLEKPNPSGANTGHTASKAATFDEKLPWRISNLKATFDLADARARYASTPLGETDLTARMDALTRTLKTSVASDYADLPDYASQTSERGAYAEAISSGRRLRDRARNVAEDVRSGTLSGRQAATLTAFPAEDVTAARQAQIDQLEAMLAATPAPTPAPGILRRATRRLRGAPASACAPARTWPANPGPDDNLNAHSENAQPVWPAVRV
jgi:hypothetical protein